MTVVAPRPAPVSPASTGATLFDAVLFDRDGTLVHDVPYNGDPALVRPVDGAKDALDRLRSAGLRIGVVTNQSGLARGRFGPADLEAVNARIEELLGPFDTWQVCPHDEATGCPCRKPAPGMVLAAAAALGTKAERCVLIGDIGRDITAAEAAGATAVLVPTRETLLSEVVSAPSVAETIGDAVDLVLRRQRFLLEPGRLPVARRRRRCVLLARSDSAGDVLVTGPAVRAIAAGSERVVMLCGPYGRTAAELLPGVDELIEWRLPWIDPRPGPVDRAEIEAMVDRIAATGAEEAVVFTSFHQSALPLALVLRMAGIGRISAISNDYPGALLDVRHQVPAGIPEAERALSLAAAAGFAPPAGDDLRLRIAVPPVRRGRYVVVHPGASVPARACPLEVYVRIVAELSTAGHRVLVTGGPDETELTRTVAGTSATDLGGRTSLPELAALIAGAACLIVGNTGPAHLAAAVGTPVVSLYAPTVPFGQWAPFRVPLVRLGDATAACRDSRAVVCPVPGHPCLSTVEPQAVLDAVQTLAEEAA
jgi:HAD superfamily hydrolase (TIGR01662 family)